MKTDDSQAMQGLLAEILAFRDGLGPDDDRYDEIIDRDVDNVSTDLMLACEHWLQGHVEYAHELFSDHLKAD